MASSLIRPWHLGQARTSTAKVRAKAPPRGGDAAQSLSELGHAVEFVKDQYRHCKAILALGSGRALLERATIPMDADDPALVVEPRESRAATEAFRAAIAKHRNWDRATDPPLV